MPENAAPFPLAPLVALTYAIRDCGLDVWRCVQQDAPCLLEIWPGPADLVGIGAAGLGFYEPGMATKVWLPVGAAVRACELFAMSRCDDAEAYADEDDALQLWRLLTWLAGDDAHHEKDAACRCYGCANERRLAARGYRSAA